MFLAIEFSRGRIIFASLFVIAFVTFIVLSYIKDNKNNKKHYNYTALFVAIGIVATIGILYLTKFLAK